MKKCVLFLIVTVIMLFAPANVLAAEQYNIDSLGISVEFPEYCDVFTRDMPENSPLFTEYETDKEEILSALEQNDQYINAVNTQTGNFIIVSGWSDELSQDLWDLSDADTNADRFVKDTETAQQLLADGSEIKPRTVGDTRFWYYETEAGGIKNVQYTTLLGGNYVSITASNAAGVSLTLDDCDTLDKVAYSFTVTTAIPKPTEPAKDFMSEYGVFIIVIAAVFMYLIYRIYARFSKARSMRKSILRRPDPSIPTQNLAAYKLHHIKPPERTDHSRHHTREKDR